MPDTTNNYNLIKPLENEFYDINQFNENSDIVDTELKRVNDRLDGIAEAPAFDGTDITERIAGIDEKIGNKTDETGGAEEISSFSVFGALNRVWNNIKNFKDLIGQPNPDTADTSTVMNYLKKLNGNNQVNRFSDDIQYETGNIHYEQTFEYLTNASGGGANNNLAKDMLVARLVLLKAGTIKLSVSGIMTVENVGTQNVAANAMPLYFSMDVNYPTASGNVSQVSNFPPIGTFAMNGGYPAYGTLPSINFGYTTNGGTLSNFFDAAIWAQAFNVGQKLTSNFSNSVIIHVKEGDILSFKQKNNVFVPSGHNITAGTAAKFTADYNIKVSYTELTDEPFEL